ncbi:MAG: 1-phosphofructokinase, partial [Lachnospiraceae bacterium]
MITTITLNVAVDKAYVIGKLTDHTVMRVNRCTNTAGGKGLNVAKVVHLCGEEVQATGFVGGFNGAYVEDMLKKQNIPSRFVHVQGETRSCINVLDEDGGSTEFLEPGEPIRPEEVQEFLDQFDDIIADSSVVTISGSVPKGVDVTMYAKLIEKIKAQGKKVVLDTSGALLKESIKACPTMVKPNTDEIEDLLGIKVNNHKDLVEGAKKLHEMGIPVVVVSLGGDGALVVSDEGIFRGQPPKIEVVNTVGCGDSMTAAFAVAFARGLSVQEALRYAIAVSAANAMTMETGSFREEDRVHNM